MSAAYRIEAPHPARVTWEEQASARHAVLLRRQTFLRSITGETVGRTFGVNGGLPASLDKGLTLLGYALCLFGRPVLGVAIVAFVSVFVPFFVHRVLVLADHRMNRALERARARMSDADVDAYFDSRELVNEERRARSPERAASSSGEEPL